MKKEYKYNHMEAGHVSNQKGIIEGSLWGCSYGARTIRWEK